MDSSSSWRAYPPITRRLSKIVPQSILGVTSRPVTTPTMKGIYNWLLQERIHKYWPIFSHLSYSTLLSLSLENINNILADLGATPIPTGARDRILKLVGIMRRRIYYLQYIDESTSLDDVARIFFHIAKTPLSSSHAEPSGEYLLDAVLQKFDFLVGVHGAHLFAHDLILTALHCYTSRLEVPRAHKEYVKTRYWTFAPNSEKCISQRKDRESYDLLRIQLQLFIQKSPKFTESPKSPRSGLITGLPPSSRPVIDCLIQPWASRVIQRSKSSLPLSSPSPPAPVSFPSDGGQLSCDFAHAWQQHFGLLMGALKNSYHEDSRYVVDCNRTWGGGRNQVMIDLGVW